MAPRWIPLLGLVVLPFIGGPRLNAALLAYDGFESYSPANGWAGMSSTNGGTGWSGNWSGGLASNTFPSGVRSMDYSSGAVSVDGGDVSFFRTASNFPVLQRSWSTGVDLTNAANAVYVSFLWQTRSGDGATYTGSGADSFFQVTVGESTSVNTNYGVYARGNDGHQWKTRFNGAASSTSGGTIAADTTYFVVLKLDRTSSSIWINPTSLTETPASVVQTGTALSGSNWDGVDTIILRSAVAAANYNFDELRIGTTYADVMPTAVPEPSAVAWLAGVAVLGVGVMRRRLS